MDGYQFWSSIFASTTGLIAKAFWPAVVLFFLYITRTKIGGLIEALANRLESAEGLGVKLGFAKLSAVKDGIDASTAANALATRDVSPQNHSPSAADKALTSAESRSEKPERTRAAFNIDLAPVYQALAKLKKESRRANVGDYLFEYGDWLERQIWAALDEIGYKAYPNHPSGISGGYTMQHLRASNLLDSSSIDVIQSLLNQRDRLHKTTIDHNITPADAEIYLKLCLEMARTLMTFANFRAEAQ